MMFPSSKKRRWCRTSGTSADLASGVLVFSDSLDADRRAGAWFSGITLVGGESRASKEMMVKSPQNVGVKGVVVFRSNT